MLDLSLPHDLLADLVLAERPSVTHALKALTARGLLHRRPDGLWALDGSAPTDTQDLVDLQAAAGEAVLALAVGEI